MLWLAPDTDRKMVLVDFASYDRHPPLPSIPQIVAITTVGSDLPVSISIDPQRLFTYEAAGGCTPSKSGSHLTLRWRKEDSNPRSPVYGELGAPEPRATRPTRQREAPEHAGVIFLELWCSPVLRCAEIFFRG